MKIIVAGSRAIKRYDLVEPILLNFLAQFSELVSGGAYGVDRLSETFAVKNNIKIKQFLPDYETWGISAPLRRNVQMAAYGEMLIAIMPASGATSGTSHMISQAKKMGIPVHEFRV